MTVAPMTFKSKLDFQYDPALTALLEQAATIADSCSAHAAAIDREDAFPAQEFGWMAKTELLTAPLYRGLGGVGLGMEPGTPLPLLRLLKHIGRGNLAVGRIYEGHVNALQLLQLYGTSEQIERYAADARQRHLFAVWNAEASDGVKLIPLGNNRYRLDGAKTFASGAGYVTRPFVNGVLPDGGWQMCIVPMDEVGVQLDPSWWQPIGMRASASYRVDFSGVEIEACALIGKPGDYTREPWFTGGSIRFAAVQLGGAEALFDATRTYLQQMDRTEDPYQQARAGEMAIAIESGNLWFRGAAEAAERADQAPDGFVAYARLMRTAIEQICLTVMRLAEQSVGARGLLRPHPFERLVRDLTMYLRQPAPDAALAGAGRYVLETPIRVAELWSHANP